MDIIGMIHELLHDIFHHLLYLSSSAYNGVVFGMMTAISGLSIIGCSNQTSCGIAVAFGGTLLAFSAYKRKKPMDFSDMIRELIRGGAMGLVIWKLGRFAVNLLKPFQSGDISSPEITPSINVELVREVGSITGASVAPVFVFKNNPGSRFGIMLGNYVINSIRLSKHSKVYSKIAFFGLVLLKSR